ncbi:substrate-binding domain-containing protein [Marivivens sp. LCG002]|uniref:substrate-binding domain-containing protein n=1 Tax=Marivivens sp. LCG002 TaxID=3051171 RepID=UPI0025562F69|nr:substrate-binding domain-containing protein [Marivivens sp. LCG002]WIV52009.1 substrate-binding domain-containing protein [Marivivens sp. LCG002]
MNLKQLSDMLGLSPTTVSRALNGYPEVSEDTRERVRLAAQKYDYKPHARAQSLATGRAFAIGHVIPISTHQFVVNPIFGDFIAGAGETYAANGYETVLSMVSDDDELSAYRQIKARGSVDGVVVHGAKSQDPRFDLLREIGLPFVAHGRSSGETEPYAWVDVNNQGAFERATAFLLDLGHRKIGLLNGPESMDFALRRRNGFEAAHAARGITPLASLMASQEMTETYGYREASRMLASDTPPTAFVVSSLISALGVRRAIERLGLRMGRDVSVVTYDDALSYLPNGDDVPVFTATRSSVREAGRIAGQILIDLINNPGAPPKTRLLEAELMVGQSTGPCPTSG